MNKFDSTTKRSLNGILLLDKPKGMTSNQALQTVKRLFSAKKAGHTGSLDPLATGLLPLCFGEATKFSQFLLEADKRYWVKAKLGIKTNTGDIEGEVLSERSAKAISLPQLKLLLNQYLGEIEQIPPMFSALKYQGKPLYKLARQGITISRQSRKVTIHQLELLSYHNEMLELSIHCSKGTYVRTLIEDIGEALGCGACVNDLRRLQVGHYQEKDMISLQQLQLLQSSERDRCLLALDGLFDTLPSVKLTQAAMYYLFCGQTILLPHDSLTGLVRLVHVNSNRFLGLGELLEDGRLIPRRLIQQ